MSELSDVHVPFGSREGTINAGKVTAAKIATGAVEAAKIGSGSVTATKIGTGAVTEAKIGAAAVSKTKLAGGFLKAAVVAGGAAGDFTVTGISSGDELVAVLLVAGAGSDVTDLSDLTSEFTISAADTINNTDGTASTGGKLLVLYLDLT